MDERSFSQQIGSEPPVTAESLTKGRVTVHRGRLWGHFEVTIKAGGMASVSLNERIRWCGKEHRGSVEFADRGAREVASSRHLRVADAVLDTPTTIARDALIAGALEALREWVRLRPLAWEAADCIAAGVAAGQAAHVVESLRAQLVAAETALETARADHEARVSALAMKGVMP